MNILIIGNGFDLAHGLKTSYKDFLEYCLKLPSENSFRQNNIWLETFLHDTNDNSDTWIDLETKIYDLLHEIFRKRTSFPSYCNFGNTYQLIYSDSHKLSLGKINDKSFKPITDKQLINLLYEQLRVFTREFQNYLINEVLGKMNSTSKYKLSLQAAGVQPNTQDVYILSFNYTDTCERLYKQKFNTYCQLKIQPYYVHGKVQNNGECALVLGTKSFDREKIDRDLLIDVNIFQKHNQRHKYGTIEAYQDLLKKLTEPGRIIKPTFHVIGHSLDKTDHKILKHIFLANKNAVIKIYYHNEEAQEKLINNITEIIGEEEVMTKVRLIDQHDEKRGILKKTETILEPAFI